MHRKRLTSVLCVLSVATAVSGSAEHKSHQGELSGPAGKTQQREKVSDCTKTLLHNLLGHCICCLFAKVGCRFTIFYAVSNSFSAGMKIILLLNTLL